MRRAYFFDGVPLFFLIAGGRKLVQQQAGMRPAGRSIAQEFASASGQRHLHEVEVWVPLHFYESFSSASANLVSHCR